MMSSTAELERVLSVGYYLIRRVNPEWWRGPKLLLPEVLLSLSRCICPLRLDVVWGWSAPIEDDDLNGQLAFGISREHLDRFAQWCTQDCVAEGADWAIFPTVAAARRFAARFEPAHEGLFLIGVGFPRVFLNPDQIMRHTIQGGTASFWTREPVALDPAGDILGYEVVSYNYGDFGHSWLCSNLQHEMQRRFGIVPNEHGFIANADDAMTVHNWIAEDDMRGTRAEPEPYFPWLLASYPLRQP
jgi:hypothetical protein